MATRGKRNSGHTWTSSLCCSQFKMPCKCFKKYSQAKIFLRLTSNVVSEIQPRPPRRAQTRCTRGASPSCGEGWAVRACGFGPRSQGQLRKLGLRGQTHQANERVWPLQGTRERASFTLNLALDLPDPSFVNSWRSRSCSILGSLKSGCAAHAHLLRLPLFTWDTENAHRRNPQVDPSLARRHLHPRSRLPGVMCTHNTRRVTLTDSRWTVSFKAAPLAGFPHRHERLEVGSNLEVHITPRTGEAHLTEQPHVDAGLTT